MINLVLTKEKRALYLKKHPDLSLEEKERRVREQIAQRRKNAKLKRAHRIIDLRLNERKTFQDIAKSFRPHLTGQRVQQIFKQATYDISTDTSNICTAC